MNVKFEPPGPAPPEPDPPPYAPEGYDWVRYDLARHVYFAARRVDRPEEAAKLGTAIHYAVVLSDNDSPVGKLHEVRLVTGKVLATEDAMEPWRDFGIEVSAALQALYRKGKLSTPAEWNSALRGISEGLILAGPDK